MEKRYRVFWKDLKSSEEGYSPLFQYQAQAERWIDNADVGSAVYVEIQTV